MDTAERPHRTTSSNSSTSELFVCFTSRLSSSSMKLSSKSILSPSRTRDPPQISLSTSLSRRLKSNGSMKGGQASPMFPTGGKRRGCGFENPEPSSPKVTCIGQVRVKTKKQGKKMRVRSKRRGEASFRKTEQGFQVGAANPDLTRQNSQSFQYQNHQNLQQECLKHRNQRWVHLPLTICEALREFSCFFPCRSSCTSSEREKEEKGGGGSVERGSGGVDDREGSCGAAFARWVVALQEGEGKGRGIELVVEEEQENDGDGRGKGERSCSQRRHVFEDIDIDLVEGKKNDELVGGEEEEKARVSICIPPKNALLLMRCRSDPVKMAALANRFWESPVHKDKYEEEEQDEEDSAQEEEEEEKEEEEGEKEEEERSGDKDQYIEMKKDEEQEGEEREVGIEIKDGGICEGQSIETSSEATEEECVITFLQKEETKEEPNENYEDESKTNPESEDFVEAKDEEENGNAMDKGETFSRVTHSDHEKPETREEAVQLHDGEEQKEIENDESSPLSSSPETFTASEHESDEAKAMAEAEEEAVMAEAEASAEGSTEEEEEKGTTEREQAESTRDPNTDPESKERENGSKKGERDRETLPECLLLMMCEPKLSMEVSKETWVCSTDFIRWLPERPAGKIAGGGKRVGVDSSNKPKLKPSAPPPQPLMQPPRSSCSFPAAGGVAGMSMATMIEQKLVGSKSSNGYEPFVLTRCKSEPMRSSAKLAPEACFWNNRKLEPHPPPAQLGVGAPAGVGF
ncbi:DNA ligase 1 [Abrus precatorius]|uniref:DNA ligase 1 n=1 Tax=Abrus precatorius TaxID=3816 RepID=A0A8B8KDB6_ABRPR|nr:DNA ligase 1 [Abrus precatorius]